ncbi:carbonic anhydrase [Singulisphaera sp. PoT]|uniref:carbonic anhydrase n=1 Tax=Singulisphaera sp. PoT TaxID=3411797 RepID=UPI003BF4813B
MANFKEYQFRTQPWFKQDEIQGFVRSVIPMKTIVIYCFDPRAAEIPKAVAERLGDEVYPGENILNDAGNRVGSTRTLFTVTNAGGRAISALQSISTMEYLFNLQNVVVVHHSFCGATGFTPEVLIDTFRHDHGKDISALYDHESLSIMDYDASLKYDIELLRSSPGVPKHVKLFGYFYDIDSGELTEVVRDIPA